MSLRAAATHAWVKETDSILERTIYRCRRCGKGIVNTNWCQLECPNPEEEIESTARATVLKHGGCQCDPPGSGEEYCTGHCYLRAENERVRQYALVLLDRWHAEDANGEGLLSVETWAHEVVDWLNRLVRGDHR